MALSEHEQRLLDQLEQQLHADDPKFAHSMASNTGRSMSTRRIVLGSLVTVAGLAVLLLGIWNQFIPVGVAGFLIMGAGVYTPPQGRRWTARPLVPVKLQRPPALRVAVSSAVSKKSGTSVNGTNPKPPTSSTFPHRAGRKAGPAAFNAVRPGTDQSLTLLPPTTLHSPPHARYRTATRISRANESRNARRDIDCGGLWSKVEAIRA